MKQTFPIFLAVLMLLLASCHKDLWNNINDLKSRVQSLEEKCNTMNTNIDALQVLINAQSSGDMISNVSEITYGGATIGYTITFTSGRSITIYNGMNGVDGKDGTDGANGQDGYTPSIGVAKDTDDVYYWTLDGTWLLDNDGNKLPVTGAKGDRGENGKDGENGQNGTNGSTPMFKIDKGYWYVSYDSGSTWVLLGQATGNAGKDGTTGAAGKDGVTPQFKIMEGDWYVSYDEGVTWNPAGQATGDKGDTGATGVAGSTPQLKIENSYWYVSLDDGATWTKLGKATGENGNAGEDGQDGVTPQLKIEDGYWYVSYDNGSNWTKLGKATGENGKDGANGIDGANGEDGQKGDKGDNGDSMFSSVTQDEEFVYFTLADGTVIRIAKGGKESTTSIDTKFAIKYDANGGVGTMTTDSVWRMKEAVIKVCDYTYAKHVFTGWNTKSDGKGTPFYLGDKIVILEDVTLYAQWQVETLFSFSTSDSVKVVFAPGNLQYQASTQTWRFAEHQYDYRGEENANVSGSYWGWIDLFECDKIQSVSANKIGPWPANSWYVMSSTQWDYLLKKRTNAASLYGSATVNGLMGVIILPDAWEQPDGVTFRSGYGYYYNVYTLSQWQQMESAGAVFLPPAGVCSKNASAFYVSNCGSNGYYWSSTKAMTTMAYSLSFSKTSSPACYTKDYSSRCSMRLVRNVK